MSQRYTSANPGGLYPYVCCDCRRAFKRPPYDHSPPPGQLETRPCPLCGKPAIWVHSRFKVPRSSDAEQWEKVRLLLSHGFRFTSLGGGVEYPETLKEAPEWVKKHAQRADRTETSLD